jgi:hypothetical protein
MHSYLHKNFILVKMDVTLILSNILERRFTFVEVLPHTTLLAVVEREAGFATMH